MGLDKVNTSFRFLPEANDYQSPEYDIGSMVLHHTYAPSKNYCTVELKMPAIKRQIPEKEYDSIIHSLLGNSLHGLKFNSASNTEFYRLLHQEGKSYVDKVRREVDGVAYTYYFSNKRLLKLFSHDHYMATVLYMNWPKRNFIRKTACKDFASDCDICLEIIADPVRGYLLESDPSFNVSYSDYFFTYVEEKHRLLLAFSVESVKSPGECFVADEPKYYIQDMSENYFSEALSTVIEYERAVLLNRAEEDRVMTTTGDVTCSPDFGSIVTHSARYSMGGDSFSANYNISTGENVPAFLKVALEDHNFEDLCMFDFKTFNARNTIHKYQYNHWADTCTGAEDGLWCAWDVSETIESGKNMANSMDSSSGEAIASQLSQAASAVGWGLSDDESSSDIEFEFSDTKEPGVNYEIVLEKPPNRKNGI